jgi:hypothetical protein
MNPGPLPEYRGGEDFIGKSSTLIKSKNADAFFSFLGSDDTQQVEEPDGSSPSSGLMTLGISKL